MGPANLSGCSSSGPAALALGQEELPEDPQGWHGGAAGLPGSMSEWACAVLDVGLGPKTSSLSMC